MNFKEFLNLDENDIITKRKLNNFSKKLFGTEVNTPLGVMTVGGYSAQSPIEKLTNRKTKSNEIGITLNSNDGKIIDLQFYADSLKVFEVFYLGTLLGDRDFKEPNHKEWEETVKEIKNKAKIKEFL